MARRHLQFFFFNDTATTKIYTLSLHDALPICLAPPDPAAFADTGAGGRGRWHGRLAADRGLRHRRLRPLQDRKSTRLNSSHANISYAVFCLKKKKQFLLS